MPKILSIRIKKFNEKLSYWWLAAIAYGSAKARTRCQGGSSARSTTQNQPYSYQKNGGKKIKI